MNGRHGKESYEKGDDAAGSRTSLGQEWPVKLLFLSDDILLTSIMAKYSNGMN